MNVLLQVALGGAIGAVQTAVRVFAVGTPLGTFLVNVLGSFVMGIVAVWFL